MFADKVINVNKNAARVRTGGQECGQNGMRELDG